jgi:predicted aldo/keto reductase-like oxidoreductase
LLGLGGSQLGRMNNEQESTRFIRTAIDNGVNYLDNSWDYSTGLCEHRMGKALLDGYRKKAFIATKINGRSKEFAEWQIEESLRRFRTDTIDLMQIHEVVHLEDPDKIFGPNGSIETLVAAKKAGKIRYIGFTSHWGPDVILKMLDVAEKNRFAFDHVMVTLNAMDPHFRNNVGKVLPVLVKQGCGISAFKSMCAGSVLKDDVLQRINVTPAEFIQYVMNLPVSVVISGMPNLEILNTNLEVARNFRPLSEAEVSSLLAKTAEVGTTGNYEWFKTPRGLEYSSKNMTFS